MSESGDIVVVGCGNVLRGDDGAGPSLVRLLVERGLPAGVTAIDAATSGLDAALRLRGARRVVVVDACVTGGMSGEPGPPPGTVRTVPAEALAELARPIVNVHACRWLEAIGLARAMLGEAMPESIAVHLIEAATTEPRIGLSPPVRDAVEALATRLVDEFAIDARRIDRIG